MSLIAHFPLTNNLKDYSGNGYELINNNCLINENGKIGSCYEFNGNTSYLKSNKTFFTDKINNNIFSISINFQIQDFNSDLMFLLSTSSRGLDQGIFINNKELIIEFTEIEDKNNKSLIIENDLKLNQWYHLIFTLNNNHLICYLNDEKKIDKIIDTPIGSWFGYYYFGQRGNNTFFYKGKLTDIKIFDYVLSKKEIKDLFESKIVDLDFNYCAEPTENLFKQNKNLVNSTGHGLTFDLIEKKNNYQKFNIKGNYDNSNYPYTFSVPGPFECSKDVFQSVSFYLECNCFDKFQSFFNIEIVNIIWDSSLNKSVEKIKDNLLFISVSSISPRTTINGEIINSFTDNIYFHSIPKKGVVFNDNDYIKIINYQLEEKKHFTPFTSNIRKGIITDKSGYKNSFEIKKVSKLTNLNDIFWYKDRYTFLDKNVTILSKNLDYMNALLINKTFTISFDIELHGMNIFEIFSNNFGTQKRNFGVRIHFDSSKIKLNLSKYDVRDQYVTIENKKDFNRHNFTFVQTPNKVIYYMDGIEVGSFNDDKNFKKIDFDLLSINSLSWGGKYSLFNFKIYSTVLKPEIIKNKFETKLIMDKNYNVYCNQVNENDINNKFVNSQGTLYKEITEIKNNEIKINNNNLICNEIREV